MISNEAYSGANHPIGLSFCKFDSAFKRCLCYINIPKNASSWSKHHIAGVPFNFVTGTFYVQSRLEWCSALNNTEYLVVLREPISRWVSGLALYLRGWAPDHHLHIHNIDWDMVFDRVKFDGHTRPQWDYIEKVDHDRVTWIKCDDNLSKNFSHVFEKFTETKLVITEHDPYNVFNVTNKIEPIVNEYYTEERQQNIVDTINRQLNLNSKYLDRLREFYRKDFELFESIKFLQV